MHKPLSKTSGILAALSAIKSKSCSSDEEFKDDQPEIDPTHLIYLQMLCENHESDVMIMGVFSEESWCVKDIKMKDGTPFERDQKAFLVYCLKRDLAIDVVYQPELTSSSEQKSLLELGCDGLSIGARLSINIER